MRYSPKASTESSIPIKKPLQEVVLQGFAILFYGITSFPDDKCQGLRPSVIKHFLLPHPPNVGCGDSNVLS